ncbi:MAG: hypothetical protein GSR85_03480 [Desulfurococcales archaeon]|nr:hypothetical protein [Desulfurococcales archaeon]
MQHYLTILVILESVSLVALLVVVLRLHDIYNISNEKDVEGLYRGLFFIMVSQIIIIMAIIIGNARISFSLYILSQSLAFSGYLLVVAGKISEGRNGLGLSSIFITATPIALDVASGVTALYSSALTKRALQVGFMLLGVSHLIRGLSTLFPNPSTSLQVMVYAETLRALGAIVISLPYVRR